jgi:hypothetical protein
MLSPMSPSSDEVIASQQAEALRLIEEKMPCAPCHELGEISLQDKEQPTCCLAESEEKKEMEQSLQNPVCFSTRGIVDVSALQQLTKEGYNYNYKYSKDDSMPPLSPTNYWDPRNAAKHNVTITRPSHDAWGIGKIVLLFCDDFTTRIYQLPWWKDFEAALQPVLDACLPPNACLIRLLLASLPPGVTIPVHHDTGEWVKSAHRVHAPILVKDPSNVLFRCGPTPTSMQRIDCTPGHVFEINNQAKHAVSNCDSDSRVHLILDYIQAPGPSRIVLDAGERLVQTRRSIDRLKDMKKRQTPSYIIIGAQKAGTTSLYDYINQHPWVVKARRRETHCLDWRWNENCKTPKTQLQFCQKFFYTEELKKHPSCLTGESTPSYLLDSRRVIPRIQQVFGGWKMKLFVMLRDPVKRASSHYAMVTSPHGTPAQLKTRGAEWRRNTLRQVVDMELQKMEDCGLIPYWNKDDEGRVDQDKFDVFFGSEEEDQAWDLYLQRHVLLNTGSYGLLTRGMYALQLRPWFRAFDREQFMVLKLESLKTTGVQAIMSQVWAHLDLPNHSVHDETPKNTRDYQPMESDVKEYLERFFEPHNRRLAQVLGTEEGDWNCPLEAK